MQGGEKIKEEEEVKSVDDLLLEAANLRKEELEEAYKEIQSICKKYKCSLDADFSINRTSIVPRVFIVDLKQ